MIKKIIGAVLAVFGGVMTGLVISVAISGGALFPHILGSIVLLAAGIFIFFFKRKGERNR